MKKCFKKNLYIQATVCEVDDCFRLRNAGDLSEPELPQMVIDVLVLRLAPLLSGERAEEWMDISVESFRALVVKSGDHLL